MIEIEKLQNITTFQGNAPFEEASTTPTNGEDGSGDPVSPTEKEKPNYDDFIDVKSKTSVKDLKAGDTIFATINSSIKDKEGKPMRVNPTGFFLVVAVDKNVTKGEYKLVSLGMQRLVSLHITLKSIVMTIRKSRKFRKK